VCAVCARACVCAPCVHERVRVCASVCVRVCVRVCERVRERVCARACAVGGPC